jgi:hypothetical protein
MPCCVWGGGSRSSGWRTLQEEVVHAITAGSDARPGMADAAAGHDDRTADLRPRRSRQARACRALPGEGGRRGRRAGTVADHRRRRWEATGAAARVDPDRHRSDRDRHRVRAARRHFFTPGSSAARFAGGGVAVAIRIVFGLLMARSTCRWLRERRRGSLMTFLRQTSSGRPEASSSRSPSTIGLLHTIVITSRGPLLRRDARRSAHLVGGGPDLTAVLDVRLIGSRTTPSSASR